jgi:hypothetical protein
MGEDRIPSSFCRAAKRYAAVSAGAVQPPTRPSTPSASEEQLLRLAVVLELPVRVARQLGGDFIPVVPLVPHAQLANGGLN